MTTTKIVVGTLAAVAVGGLVYMYVNKKGVFKVNDVVEGKPNVSNADGRTASMQSNVGGRTYPPHTYIKNVGWTDSHGKVI